MGLHRFADNWRLDWLSQGQEQSLPDNVSGIRGCAKSLRGRNRISILHGGYFARIADRGLRDTSGENKEIHARGIDAGNYNSCLGPPPRQLPLRL